MSKDTYGRIKKFMIPSLQVIAVLVKDCHAFYQRFLGSQIRDIFKFCFPVIHKRSDKQVANTAQMRSEVKTSLQILTNSSLVTVPITTSFITTKNQSIDHQGKSKTFNGHRPVEGVRGGCICAPPNWGSCIFVRFTWFDYYMPLYWSCCCCCCCLCGCCYVIVKIMRRMALSGWPVRSPCPCPPALLPLPPSRDS